MRPSRFTDDQIMHALHEVRDGTPAVTVCRRLGITQTTFYRWRTRYGGANASESRVVRQLREENGKLKQLVADLLLDRRAALEPSRRKG